MINRLDALDGVDFKAGALLNINKPVGLSSFAVVKKVRGWTRCQKVGHAGTLDPLAQGVLIVCTGKATKQADSFMSLPKEYEAVVRLGQTSDTDDAEGVLTQVGDVPEIELDAWPGLLSPFIGEIQQVPPLYSAIKQGGKRLYALARQGKTVERPPRTVQVYGIDVLDWATPDLKLRVRCGRGTYVRSLARDIGQALGCGGYLAALSRTAIGDHRIEQAWTLDELKSALLDGHETL